VQAVSRVPGQKGPEDEAGREGVSGEAGGGGAAVSVWKAEGEMMVDAGEVDEHEA
jgi:hypothetical protein